MHLAPGFGIPWNQRKISVHDLSVRPSRSIWRHLQEAPAHIKEDRDVIMAAVSVSGEASRAQPRQGARHRHGCWHGGKQTQHIIIWQWAQERKFVLKLQTYHENMWKQWNPEQLYNYQPVLPFEVPRNALEEWDLVSFWYISTLAGCSLEHATSELKADPEFLAAKSWHKAKVATSLWSFWRLVLETSYLFINYLFYRKFNNQLHRLFNGCFSVTWVRVCDQNLELPTFSTDEPQNSTPSCLPIFAPHGGHIFNQPRLVLAAVENDWRALQFADARLRPYGATPVETWPLGKNLDDPSSWHLSAVKMEVIRQL